MILDTVSIKKYTLTERNVRMMKDKLIISKFYVEL